MTALLDVRNLAAFYGQAQAVFDASLTVRRGEVVAMLGRNGAGKTTTIHAICRMLGSCQGEILFDGQDVMSQPSHRVARLGIGLVPEGRRCFAPLTVWENLMVAARPPGLGDAAGSEWDLASVTALFPRLGERQTQLAHTLSGGEQQMLAIGRALMTNPRLLILDEATEGLAPTIRQEIWTAIAALKSSGQAILLVDKNLEELLPITDVCTVFDRGRTVWHGAPDALTGDVRTAHLSV